MLNAAAQIAEHWIGDRTSVEDQAKQALIGPPSFGMPSYEAAALALSAIPGCAPLFVAAFPQDAHPISADNFAVTRSEADRFVFKVPMLRNVAMTSPYFHDGSVARLSDAVRIMAKIQLGDDLSAERVGDIVAFLGSLTGRIPADLLNAPLLPSTRTFDTDAPGH